MEDFIRFRRLKKNKSDEDHKQSACPEVRTGPRLSTSSLPSPPPAYHSVPFTARTLGEWARAKRLEEILSMFPADMSLLEFSHLSHTTAGLQGCGDPIII